MVRFTASCKSPPFLGSEKEAKRWVKGKGGMGEGKVWRPRASKVDLKERFESNLGRFKDLKERFESNLGRFKGWN